MVSYTKNIDMKTKYLIPKAILKSKLFIRMLENS